MPLYIGLTWFVVAFFMVLKGGPALNNAFDLYHKNKDGTKDINSDKLGPVIGVALGVGAFCAAFSTGVFTLNPKFDEYCRKTEEEEMAAAKAANEKKATEGTNLFVLWCEKVYTIDDGFNIRAENSSFTAAES